MAEMFQIWKNYKEDGFKAVRLADGRLSALKEDEYEFWEFICLEQKGRYVEVYASRGRWRQEIFSETYLVGDNGRIPHYEELDLILRGEVEYGPLTLYQWVQVACFRALGMERDEDCPYEGLSSAEVEDVINEGVRMGLTPEEVEEGLQALSFI